MFAWNPQDPNPDHLILCSALSITVARQLLKTRVWLVKAGDVMSQHNSRGVMG